MEGIQTLLQRDGVDLTLTAVTLAPGDAGLESGARVADDPSRRAPGLHCPEPGRTLAIVPVPELAFSWRRAWFFRVSPSRLGPRL
jgi:hypothetical protein